MNQISLLILQFDVQFLIINGHNLIYKSCIEKKHENGYIMTMSFRLTFVCTRCNLPVPEFNTVNVTQHSDTSPEDAVHGYCLLRDTLLSRDSISCPLRP